MRGVFYWGLETPLRSLRFGRCYVNEAATVFAFGKHYHTINQSKESVVFAHAYIKTGMMHCATLAFEDVAGLSMLATKNLHTQTFAFGFTSVLRTTYTFFMCHCDLDF